MKTAKICALIAFILNLLSLLALWSPLKGLLSILGTFSSQQLILSLVAPILQVIATVTSLVLWLYFGKKEKENQIVKNSKFTSYLLIALAPILYFASFMIAAYFVYNLAAAPAANYGTTNQTSVQNTDSNGVVPITPDEVKKILK